MRKNHPVMLRKYALVAALLAGLLAASIAVSSCQRGCTGPVESIRIGALRVESVGLIYVAQERKFFEQNGLTVTIKDYDTGVGTIDALLKGDVDIAWSAEFPLVRRAFEKEKISILCVTDKFSYHYLFCRKDRGINSVHSLQHKKIGVPRGTISEFYLGRFLELNNLTIKEITMVDVAPPELVDAIMGGSVDGVIVWGPFANQIKAAMGDKIVVWPVNSGQAGYGVSIGRNEWLASHKEPLKRFLKSLVEAEEYVIRQPAGAKAVVKKWMSYDDAVMETVWSENQYSISLDQSLIAAMEDEARWMISNKLTTERHIPDFMDYVYLDGLKEVKPDAVNMIR